MTLVQFSNGSNNSVYINPLYVEAIIGQKDGTRIYMNGGSAYYVYDDIYDVIDRLQNTRR